MSGFHAYFFDFDGTIGDTDVDIRAAWLAAIRQLRLPSEHFDSTFRVGPAIRETAMMLYPELSDAESKTLQNTYKHFYDDAENYKARPYPGIIEKFRLLKSTGKKLYIVTNKRIKPLQKMVDLFDLTFFDGIFAPDTVDPEHHLTKAESLALAIKVSAISGSKCLMVGDTSFDLAAGKANSVATCAVTWGYGSRNDLINSGADFVISTPEDLP